MGDNVIVGIHTTSHHPFNSEYVQLLYHIIDVYHFISAIKVLLKYLFLNISSYHAMAWMYTTS